MKKQNFKPRGQNLKDYNHALEMETKIRARFTEALENDASENELSRLEAEMTRATLKKLLAWHPDRHHHFNDKIQTYKAADARNVKQGFIA